MKDLNCAKEQSLLAEVSAAVGVSVADVLSHRRTQALVDARCMIAAILTTRHNLRQGDVARLLEVSQPAICKLLKRHNDLLNYNRTYRNNWESLNENEKHLSL